MGCTVVIKVAGLYRVCMYTYIYIYIHIYIYNMYLDLYIIIIIYWGYIHWVVYRVLHADKDIQVRVEA